MGRKKSDAKGGGGGTGESEKDGNQCNFMQIELLPIGYSQNLYQIVLNLKEKKKKKTIRLEIKGISFGARLIRHLVKQRGR